MGWGNTHCGSFEIPKSDVASLAYPQHMQARAADSGQRKDVPLAAVVPRPHNSPKVTILKYFRVFFAAFALEIFELTLL